MKPASIKEYRKKEARLLLKERSLLYKKHRDLGYRELEKPIRHGWYIELKLLPQLERYKCQPQIEEIVEKLSRHYWGATKEEVQKKWNGAESKHLIYRGIPTLSHRSYSKLTEKAKRFCTAFFFKEDKKVRRRYYVRIPKHAHKIKFIRAYTTHSKIIDPLIEQRLDLIEQHLMKNGWFGIAYTSRFSRCRWQLDETIKDRRKTKVALEKYKHTTINELKNDPQWANRN
ncbi:MAG: hypothetical protein ACI8ZM_000763 [Crocinitomix sp.]|jgi:hypothetical protein